MDTVRATSDMELVFVTGWRICLAHASLSTLYYVVEQIMNLVVESMYSRHGEVEGTLNCLYT
jgi:uncharacterized membrane protein